MSYSKNTNLNPQICQVEIIPARQVESVVDSPAAGFKIVTPLFGYDFVNLYGSPSTIEFSEEDSQVEQGLVYDQKLEAFYPGEDINQELDNFSGTRWIVRFTLNSGVKLLIGDIENPSVAKTAFSVKRGGRTITFTRRSAHQAYFTN